MNFRSQTNDSELQVAVVDGHLVSGISLANRFEFVPSRAISE